MRTLLALVVGLITAAAASAQPTALPLVQASQMRYDGSFTIADASPDTASIAFGGNGLGMGADGQSLYIAGHDWYKRLCRISIPPVGGVAQIVTACAPAGDTLGGETNIGGTLVYGNRLIVSKYLYYDASGSAAASHTSGALGISGFGPLQRLTGAPPGWVGGYMGLIPPEWQASLGGPAYTGQCCGINIISRTSWGPSLSAFNPAEVDGSGSVSSTLLLGYPSSAPLAPFDGAGSQNTTFNAGTVIGGVAFVPGTRSVLFIGRHGLGPVCYGEPSECGDPGGYKGYHSYPYTHQVWAYDASELAAVRAGTKASSAVRPYAIWRLPLPATQSATMAGATFNPATGKLYVTEAYSDHPRVHVLTITAGTPPPPTEICGNGIDDNGNGQIDEGCPPPVPEICGDGIDNNGNGQIDEGCPPPPPPPTTVNVSTVAQLQNAVASLQSGQTIVVAAGTYQLTQTLQVPENRSNVTIKGATGNRDQVVLRGAGMTGALTFGIWIDNVTSPTIQDLTIRDWKEHGLILGPGVKTPVLRNLHIIDIGDQFIKNNPSQAGGVDNGLLENSLLEYTTQAPDCYTNGLDVHHGRGWVVRATTFKNFRCTGLAGPAVLVWNGSSGTVVERSTFVNNHRDIGFGFDNTKTAQPPVSNGTLPDHSGGAIRNNMIVRTAGQGGDVAISVADSPTTQVVYNTILLRGTFPNAIEYRFARTQGVDIRNNATDGAILAREGAAGAVTSNVTTVQPGCFVGVADLHVLPSCAVLVNKGVAIAGVTTDFDGQPRPQGGASEIGADEVMGVASTPCIPGTTYLPPSPRGAWVPATCDATGVQTRTEVWTRTGDIQPTGGGAACPAPTQSRTEPQVCTPPTTETMRVVGTVKAITQGNVFVDGVPFVVYTITIDQGPYGTPTLGPYGGLQIPGMSRPIRVGDSLDYIWAPRP